MGRHEPIRLREARGEIAPGAEIIDAEFRELSGPRRTVWGRVKSGLQALVWAAAIGFLIPPAWVLFQIVGEMIKPF